MSSTDGSITWTATFMPTADTEDATNVISVNKAGVIDVAGNTGTGTTNSPNYAIDTILPSIVSVVMSDTALQIGDTSTLTVTLSEAATGFTADDVVVGSGIIDALAGGPTVYTATFTPTAGVENTTNVVTVGTAWTDIAGNAPLAGASSLNYTVDTKAPTAAISYSDPDALVKAGDLLTITADFSEPLLDSPVVQLAISGSNTQVAVAMTKVTTTQYTYVHTVGAGDGAATVALSVGTDAAGNVVASVPTSGATFTVDNTAPATPVIASIAGDNYINNSEQAAVHVVGTAEANSIVSVTLTGGASVGPVVGTATGAGTFDITLDTTILTDSTITPSVTATDAAGNISATTAVPTAIKDVIAPTVSSITTKDANTNGSVETATIVFSENVKDSTFSAGTFSIGGTVATTFTSGTSDDATVDVSHGGIAGTDAKTVAYTPGSATDLAGNPLAVFSQTSTDGAGPVMISAKTVSTTRIDTLWSEVIDGATVNDSGTEF
ncbi:MAG: Ig-like domain-containing protein, partial [Nanoarchaeota archaeon]